MAAERGDSRRSFLRSAGGAGALVSIGVPMIEAREASAAVARKEEEEEEVSPAEDLMREHGVLDRDALGESFEKKEHELFGEDGFEGMVDRVATIEKELGVLDLGQFTPR